MTINQRFRAPKQILKACLSTAVVLIGLWGMPTLAADPFRDSNPRDIDDTVQDAFDFFFKDGNYKQAEAYLKKSESRQSKEPMTYAMLSSLAYLDQDWETFKSYGTKTLDMAKEMIPADPLRGNLYTAVGYFLEGAYDFEKEGPISALTKLQKVFEYLDKAKEIDSNDPELNLITGYMDLMLAVNLPFSDPSQAIDKLETYAFPSYLAYRGIAVGYRDLKQYSKAIDYIDRSMETTPSNPDVFYLKAQILRKLGQEQESLDFFNKALEKQTQLPKRHAAQITYEQCKLENKLTDGNRNCSKERNRIRKRGTEVVQKDE